VVGIAVAGLEVVVVAFVVVSAYAVTSDVSDDADVGVVVVPVSLVPMSLATVYIR